VDAGSLSCDHASTLHNLVPLLKVHNPIRFGPPPLLDVTPPWDSELPSELTCLRSTVEHPQYNTTDVLSRR